MSHDLRRDLHDLSQSERPFLDDLPIALLQKRAHRRRVQRAATYSAVGAGTVAVLALGGIAGASALRHRGADPEPPAVPAPTPTPTTSPASVPAPTPRTTPTTTPTPAEEAWAPGWEACADTFYDDSFVNTDDEENLWWSSAAVDWQVSPNVSEPFELGLQLYTTSPQAQTVEARLVDVWATQFDGTTITWNVVGIATRPLESLTQGVIPAADEAEDVPLPLAPVEVQITSCASAPGAGGDGELDVPLADGAYELVARTDVTMADGTIQQVYSVVGMLGAYLPESDGADPTEEPTSTGPGLYEPFHLVPGVPLRLGTELTMNNATKSAQEQESFCGKDASTVTLLSNTPQAPATLSATAFLADGELVVQMTTTNTGPALAGADIGLPMAYIARDGRLVGLVQNPRSYFAIDQWPAAESVQYELAVGRFTCTFMLGEPWPAGTYEIFYQQFLRPGDGTAFDMSGRSTFTIE